jgi:hypothetical protein
VGKICLATAVGHAAVRRRCSVHSERTGRLLTLPRVDVFVLDNCCLTALGGVAPVSKHTLCNLCDRDSRTPDQRGSNAAARDEVDELVVRRQLTRTLP